MVAPGEEAKDRRSHRKASLGSHECLYQILAQPIKQVFTYITSEILSFCWRWRKRQRVTKVLRMHPVGTVKLCPNSHGNPSNGCPDTSLWATNVDLTVALGEK